MKEFDWEKIYKDNYRTVRFCRYCFFQLTISACNRKWK